MSVKSVKLYGPSGQLVSSGAYSALFEGAQQTRKRPYNPRVQRDFDENLTTWGQRELMAAGRFIFANCPPLKQAINQIANLAIGKAYMPKYMGSNLEWGTEAQNLLTSWHQNLDVRGGIWNWNRLLKVWSQTIKRDGDVGLLLTENTQGAPRVQTIPGHRICNGPNDRDGVIESITFVRRVGGNSRRETYNQVNLRNGVFYNSVGRALGYRVVHRDGKNWTDYSSEDLALFFDPDWPDQFRGVSPIADGVNDWHDLKQVKEFIKLALKKEASYAVVEQNALGEAPDAEDFDKGTERDEQAGPHAALYEESVEGGMHKYITEADKVTFPGGNRPSGESQAFWEKITRDAFSAIGWPMEFYDTLGKGGAAIRLIMELAQPTIERTQQLAGEIALRLDRWRIARAIRDGELKQDAEWYRWRHTLPRQITADRKYSSDIDRDNYQNGFISFQDVVGRQGRHWEDVRQEQEEEVNDLLTRARRIAEKHGISLDSAVDLIQKRDVTVTTSEPDRSAEDGEGGEPEEDHKQMFDAYGVGVRAGAITPQKKDEEYFRSKVGLPEMDEAVDGAWDEDGGYRRPITLQSGEAAEADADAKKQAADDDGDTKGEQKIYALP